MRKLSLLAAVAAIVLMATGHAMADDVVAGAGANSGASANGDQALTLELDQSDHSTYNGSNYGDLDVAVNSAFAPNLWATSDTCMGSSSVGVQALLFGFSTGTTWRDEDCVRRKDARELYNMGNTMPQLRVASVARMCQKSANIAAMHAAGLACPGEGTPAMDNTRIRGSQFYGIHTGHVDEGSAPKAAPVGAVVDKALTAPVAKPRG